MNSASRLPHRAALALAALFAFQPLASAQALLGSVEGSLPNEQVGLAVAVLPGDGLGPDRFAVGSKWGPAGAEAGSVRIVSGDDYQVLLTIPGLADGDEFGSALAPAGDIDGDGTCDLVVGAWSTDVGAAYSGTAVVLDPVDGTVLRTWSGMGSWQGLGYSVASGRDLDLDGTPDVVLGAPFANGSGQVRAYSGETGALLLLLAAPFSNGFFGNSVAIVDDADGDGRPDIAVGAEQAAQVVVYSSLDGTVLRNHVGAPGSRFGHSLADAGDVDADGWGDLLVGAPLDDTASVNAGRVSALSGADGSELLSFTGLQLGSQCGSAVASGGDIDADGHADIVLGCAGAVPVGVSTSQGRIRFQSGADGSQLGLWDGTLEGGLLGTSLSGPGDLNGDGYPDSVAGEPGGWVAGVSNAGAVRALSNRMSVSWMTPKRVLWSAPGPVTLVGKGFGGGTSIEVLVDGVPATSVTLLSPTAIGFVPPVGLQDQVADVTLALDGLQLTVPDALTYEGVSIVDIYPDNSLKVGGKQVTLRGHHIPDDGSVTVTFLENLAQIVALDPPNAVTVEVPIYDPPIGGEPSLDVEITCSNGYAGSDAFLYSNKLASTTRGNIAGGTTLKLVGPSGTHQLGDFTVTMGIGGPQAQVVGIINGKSIEIVTPPFPDQLGNVKMDISVNDPVGGNEKWSSAWLYTPALVASVEPDAFGGGLLDLRWITDPAAGGGQSVSLWIGDPFSAPLSTTLPGYAGTLHEVPFAFVFLGLPVPATAGELVLAFPPLDPAVSGLELRLQSLVSGEGGPKGSFTNTQQVVLP